MTLLLFYTTYSSSSCFLRHGDPLCNFLGVLLLSAIYIPTLLWHSSAYILLYVTAVVLLLLLYFYRTHCGLTGCRCKFFSCCVLCCATAVPGTTAVSGWLGGSVRGCGHAFVGYLKNIYLPLYRPRVGIVQRTTSIKYR